MNINIASSYGYSESQIRQIRSLIERHRDEIVSAGKRTSAAEVTNVSRHGIWLLSATGEKFLSFKDFPWFMEAPIGKVMNVEEPQPGHYYWPDLDADLSDRIIEVPHLYTRVSR